MKPLVDYFISDLNSLKKITRASQVLPFRMFCSFFDFLEDKQRYLTGIAQVFDQLIASSSLSKTFQLLNQMPYPIILFIVKRLINQNSPDVIAHLNEHWLNLSMA